LEVKYKTIYRPSVEQKSIINKMDLIVFELQIDCMENNDKLFPIIVYRTKEEKETPFLQFKFERESLYQIRNELEIQQDNFPLFELQIQPLTLSINHEVLLNIIALNKKLVHSYYLMNEIPKQDLLLNTTYNFPVPNEEAIKSYFQLIRIHSLDLKLTYRKNKSQIILQNSPTFIRSLSNTFFDFARITESPLSLKEIILINSFQNRYTLFWAIMGNYSKQALNQFYRMLFSSEIIGNPIGLVDKIGTGVVEFVSEPYKGLLLGPKQFVSGLSKGTQSLMSNVIGGGFSSVADITGSLYNVLKEEGTNPDSIVKDLGLLDISKGIKGIAYKPYRGYKEKGISGLVSGIPKGIFGATVSPITALLHLSHTISKGVAAKARKINQNFEKISRKRYPRCESKNRILIRYDKNIEKLYEICWFNKKLLVSDTRYFVNLIREQVLITDTDLFLIADRHIIKRFSIATIQEKEIHWVHEKYAMLIKTQESKMILWSKDPNDFYRIYYAL
jgi:hypothetical protein